MRIAHISFTPLNLPMRGIFVTARGKKNVTRNLAVTVQLSNGIKGYGEASASLAWPQDNQKTMSTVLKKIMPSLADQPIEHCQSLVNQVWEAGFQHSTAASALECALLDAFTQNMGITLWSWLGAKKRSVTTMLTISGRPPKQAARIARKMARQGFRQFKIKVSGADFDQDVERVLHVHQAAPRAALVIDANQGFQIKNAILFALLLRQKKLPVLVMEQPVSKDDWEGLRAVEREGKIPVAADESARSVQETKKIIKKRLVSVINIKLAKSGVLGALEIIRLAKRTRTRLMIGCMAESARGLMPSVALACGTGAFEFVDLDSHLLLRAAYQNPFFKTEGPRLSIRCRP